MIRQFDLVANPGARQRPNVPYMVILQSHHLSMETTVVAPVRTSDEADGIGDVEVPIIVEDLPHAIMVAELAHLPTGLIGRRVGSLADHEDDIRRALDQLFTGF